MFEAISAKGSPNQHNRFGLSKIEEEDALKHGPSIILKRTMGA